MKTVGLLFFDPYSINKGTAALAYSAIFVLEEIAKEKFNYVFLEPMKWEKDLLKNTLSINDKEIPIETRRCFPDKTVKDKVKRLCLIKQYFNSLKVDYILDIGEGDSYSDIYGTDRFYLFDNIKQAYLRKRKHFALMPQTIGPFKNKKIEKQAVKTLNKINLVCSRDSKTTDFIKKILPDKEVVQIPDFAFFLPYTADSFYVDNSVVNVGINISGLLWHGGYTKNNQFELGTDYKELMIKTIECFLSQKNICVHLIPHVVHEKDTVDNDYPVSLELFKRYKSRKLCLAPFFMTPIEAKSFISRMDFFIGARLHATIAAFSSGVPCVPVGYSRKFTGLYKDTYGYDHVVDLTETDPCLAFNEIIDNFNNRLQIKQEAEEIMNTKIIPQKESIRNVLAEFLRIGKC